MADKVDVKRSSVLVSDATRGPGLALIRELGRAGFGVRGADARRLPFGLHSRYSPPYLDYGPSSELELQEALLKVVRTARPEVLLPVSTAISRVVSKNRPLFESLTAVNIPAYNAFLTAMDNEATLRTCAMLGIPCPRILDKRKALELLRLQRQSPVVIKPRMDFGAARGVQYATSIEAVEKGIAANALQYDDSVLQEYVPGDTSAMRSVLLLFDRSRKLLASLTVRKILQWPMEGGLAALAMSTHEPELVRQVLPFFEHLGWQGPAEVELKYDDRDGIPKVIEVNPRLPSYTGFPERCGIPFSTMMVEAATSGWSGPICPSYPAGVRFVRTGELLKILLHRLRSRRRETKTKGRIWTEITAQTRPASLDLSDPLPRIGKLLCELSSITTSRDLTAADSLKD